jgi:hypothetical protein
MKRPELNASIVTGLRAIASLAKLDIDAGAFDPEQGWPDNGSLAHAYAALEYIEQLCTAHVSQQQRANHGGRVPQPLPHPEPDPQVIEYWVQKNAARRHARTLAQLGITSIAELMAVESIDRLVRFNGVGRKFLRQARELRADELFAAEAPSPDGKFT